MKFALTVWEAEKEAEERERKRGEEAEEEEARKETRACGGNKNGQNNWKWKDEQGKHCQWEEAESSGNECGSN